MQINQSTLAALYKGYRTLYLEAFQAGAPLWDRLAMRTTSTAEEEIYHWLGALPGMRKLLGEIVIQNLAASKYSITNDEFESTIGVKQAAIERDTYGIYNPLFASMGLAARQHPDELTASLLINGFTNKCYTGKAFFAANHEPEKGKVKFSNVGVKKLSVANFSIARANIKSRLNAAGRPMNLGMKLLLIVSPANEDLGRSILQADFVQNAQGQQVSNVQKGTAELVVWPQLAIAEDAWFVLETGYPVRPLIVQFEKEPDVQSLTAPTSDHVFKNHEFLYQSYGRYNAGYGLPELAYGSDGTQAA